MTVDAGRASRNSPAPVLHCSARHGAAPFVKARRAVFLHLNRGCASMRLAALAARWRAEGGYGELLRLAIPLILSTGSWSLQHFVDRMFLAWYSPESIAASTPAGILNYTLMSPFIGTAGFVSTFVAQYHWADRPERIGPTT